MLCRYGEKNVTSRAGLSQPADYLIGSQTDIIKTLRADRKIRSSPLHCILVDEAQFLVSITIHFCQAIVMILSLRSPIKSMNYG